MPTKTVKVAFTNTGLDKLMDGIQTLADQVKDMRDGLEFPVTMEGEEEVQTKLDDLSGKLDTMKTDGLELPVALEGADRVETQLSAITDQTGELRDRGIDIPVAIGDEAAGSLGALNASLDETTASINTMVDSQSKLVAGSSEVIASQEAIATSVRGTAAAWGELGAVDVDTTAKEKVSSDTQDDLATKTAATGGAFSGLKSKLAGASLGLVAVGGYSIYVASKFDEMATQLVTGAGESVKNLDLVKAGMLAVSAQTATSATDVEQGMYLIESAGFHGAEGLKVLGAAAEGAKVGNASLASVANALTSALNAYHLPATDATKVTNELIATVASGKMHMDDLATSIGNVLPVAAKAHLSLAQVGGALATMTMQGMSTRRATMNLANAIRALESPNATASSEMRNLGLNANEVSANLGKVGLTGTLDQLTEAILKNSKGGTVMAAGFSAMTGPTKEMAESILAGKMSTEQLTDAEKNMTPQQAALIAAFAKSASSATGLSQTFTGAMKNMMGGATGLQVALLLGGSSASTFAKNVKSVQDAADSTSKAVTGFALIQQDAAFRQEQLEVSTKDMAISLGDALMPTVEAVIGPLGHFASMIASSSAASRIFAVSMALLLGAFVGSKAVSAFNDISAAGKQLIGIFTSSSVAADADAASTDAATGATEGFTVALLANPVGLIIAGLVLLGVTIYELVTRVKTFRDFWIEAFGDIETIAKDAFTWLENNWKLALAIMLSAATAGMSIVALEIYNHWQTIEHDASVALDFLRESIVSFGQNTEAVFTDIYHAIEIIWHDLWNATIGLEVSAIETLFTGQNHFSSETTAIFSGIDHDVESIWDTMWNNTIGRLENGVRDAENLMSQFESWIGQKFSSAGTWLTNAGKDLIQGLYNGAMDMIGDVGSWASKIGNDIVNAVKNFFGIHSPSTVFMGIGTNIMAGLLKGLISSSPASMVDRIFGGFDQAMVGMLGKGFVTISELPAKALATITSWASKVGATISGIGKSIWDELFGGGTSGGATAGSMSASAIAAMWTAQGGPSSAAGNMARIAMAESGDQPGIVQKGEPPGLTGYGLYQITPTSGITQGGQFGNLLNAVNNTRAAISLFSRSGYSPWTSDPVGASLVYASGGMINELVQGIGMSSGKSYTFGEAGSELVTPMGGFTGGNNGGGGDTININIGVATNPNETAQAIHQMLVRYKTKKGGIALGLG